MHADSLSACTPASLAALTDAHLFETGHTSPQPFLWDLGDAEWHLVRRLRPYRPRRRPALIGVQEPLFPGEMLALPGGS